ncbi:MAG: hypothetical protein KGJ55_07755, partial [Gammaproteobacteria bacterium]|nr:hypothetical protein [Gammaproteobacteria bacterium]
MRASALRWLRGVTLIAAVANVPAFAHGIMLGVGVHFINVPSVQPTLLDLARKIGFDAIRDDAEWKFVETTKGVYRIPPAWDQFVDSARQRGIEPLLILDYGNPLYDRGK